MIPDQPYRRWTYAWVTLCAAFVTHVWDEATSGFLEWFNATNEGLRSRWEWLPFTPFSYRPWLTSLILAIVILTALTPLVWKGRRALLPVSLVYGVIHVLNAVAHMTVSVVAGRIMPGTRSSPTLLLAALWLLWEAERVRMARPTETAR